MLKSIRNRLVLLSAGITAVAMLALSLATVLMARHDAIVQSNTSIAQITNDRAVPLANWVIEKQRLASALTQAVGQPDDQFRLVSKSIQKAGSFDSAYMVYANKHPVFNEELEPGYDGTTRPWYVQAAKSTGPVITPAYIDSGTARLCISFAEAVRQNGEVTAVVSADMFLDSLAKMVAEIKPMPQSFAFLLDEQGRILAHPDPKLALKPVSAISKNLTVDALRKLAHDHISGQEAIDGRPHLLYAAPVGGTAWTLVVAVDAEAFFRPVQNMMKLVAAITLVAVLIALAIVIVGVKHQLRRLPDLQAALEDIASGEGDLTRRLPADGEDELAKIGRAFNLFSDKIVSILKEIRAASHTVHSASAEIARGNLALSDRTSQQASSLEETSAAMEQLTATVQNNAAHANQAAGLVEQASRVATEGGDTVADVVRTMGDIEASARKIADIIGVIDSIAFQTNILALNAAVEAARAGETGRGFAVVASEVRSLAQKSATAAQEIKTLIESSVSQVEAGSALVRQAGGTMTEIVDSVGRVAQIVREIDNASKEQSIGISEVGQAVTQMDRSTQQNASLVEEAASTANTLQDQAAHLTLLVKGFVLDAHGHQQTNGQKKNALLLESI